MRVDATERLNRLLAVLALFDQVDEITHEELAARTGVDAATLLDDLRALTERADEPGGFVESVGIEFGSDRVAIRSSHFLRPMRLTLAELCALELGLAMHAGRTPPDERPVIDRARRRVRDAIVAAPESAAATDGWYAEAPDVGNPGVLEAIRRGVRESRKVRLSYRKGAGVSSTTRVVHPYALVPTHGTWFLVAHCERTDGMRLFRADRIEHAELLNEQFDRPLDLSIEALLPDGKPYLGDRDQRMVVRYSQRIARWIAERESLPLDEDGSVTVSHPLGDIEWAVRHVLQYGAEAEVLEPASVRDAVVEHLHRCVHLAH